MAGEFYRSLGLELSGPKSDRSAMAVMDYHPKTQKLILVDIQTELGPQENQSADEALYTNIQLMSLESRHITGLAIHGPISLPPGFEMGGKSVKNTAGPKKGPPGYSAQNQQIEWMFQVWKRIHPQPKPFVPYLQRPCEIFLRYMMPEKFQIPDGLGANSAPIAARLNFLKPYLAMPLQEVFPKASVSRLVTSLGMSRAVFRDYLDMERGIHTRELFFESLSKKLPQIFLYEKDLEMCIVHISAFNAFVSALTQHLIFRKQCDLPPKNFPRSASWIYVPKRQIKWSEVF
jgi:hypothetical protein